MCLYSICQLCILAGAWRRSTGKPRVEPTARDLQDSTHHRDGESVFLTLHVAEGFRGVAPVSCANHAAASFRISCSSRSVRFSRRKRLSSARSSLVNPSLRIPPSRSACAIQLRIVVSVGSNSWARVLGLLPARARSTIRCRKSGGYGGLLRGIFLPPPQRSTCPRNRGNSSRGHTHL